ncbi:hypothetical protein VSDG_05664 [Cytospora chrysosperma]|uniref:Uncharacterized protein n=1 Tax=Cytospora chrysosperma TaxID=252740 RepID=A0A423VTB4_CYTCH|nr:hypothetical protein VSDG_05664 [Valsa sordida]
MSTRSSHHHGSSRGSGSSRSVKPASTARPSNANALVPLRRQHGDSESTRSHATGISEPESYWAHEYGGGDAGSVCSSQQGRRGGRSSPAVASWVDDQGSIRYAGSDMPPASEGGYDDRGEVRDAGEALADLDSESVASSRRSGASGHASRRRQPDLGQPKPKPKKGKDKHLFSFFFYFT